MQPHLNSVLRSTYWCNSLNICPYFQMYIEVFHSSMVDTARVTFIHPCNRTEPFWLRLYLWCSVKMWRRQSKTHLCLEQLSLVWTERLTTDLLALLWVPVQGTRKESRASKREVGNGDSHPDPVLCQRSLYFLSTLGKASWAESLHRMHTIFQNEIFSRDFQLLRTPSWGLFRHFLLAFESLHNWVVYDPSKLMPTEHMVFLSPKQRHDNVLSCAYAYVLLRLKM